MPGIVEQLASAGFEADQRLCEAIRFAAQRCLDETLTDAQLFYAICKLNPRGLQNVPLSGFESLAEYRTLNLPLGLCNPSKADVGLARTPQLVIDNLINSGRNGTIGTSELLSALIEANLLLGDSFINRGFLIDSLATIYGASRRAPLSDLPGIQQLLLSLHDSPDGVDDFQYSLSFSGNRIVFRVTTTLGDFVQSTASGLYIAQRTLLTHFDKLGLFTSDSIDELNDLINNKKASEADFQHFFERHPHFLRRNDYREVHPHVYLTRQDDGPLIPDFILTNRDSQDAAIVELKRAAHKARLIRHQDNRLRFADAVMEARAQLLEYRDWFEQAENREMLRSRIGMTIFRPRLMVIIGRSSEFQDGIDRQKLRARHADLEVVTYDDIARFARERRVFIEKSD